MVSFESLFPEAEQLEVRTAGHAALPDATYAFTEFYCEGAACECRRVVLRVVEEESGHTVATINYAFDPPEPPFDDEGQWFLDPLNPQSDLSAHLLEIFEGIIESDEGYHRHLEDHYERFKSVARDPAHPANAKLTPEGSDWLASLVSGALSDENPAGLPDQIRDHLRRSVGTRVGRNDPCPCGSGRKFKKCCGR